MVPVKPHVRQYGSYVMRQCGRTSSSLTNHPHPYLINSPNLGNIGNHVRVQLVICCADTLLRCSSQSSLAAYVVPKSASCTPHWSEPRVRFAWFGVWALHGRPSIPSIRAWRIPYRGKDVTVSMTVPTFVIRCVAIRLPF
jgi:hypothetical protein